MQPVERAEYEGVDYAWVMQTTFVVTILPDMMTDLGITANQFGRTAWIINGYLVGREFFELIAFRRMDQAAMREARRAHGGKIFSGGFLLAMMMSVPLLNLVMPVVSAAYFTHFFHGLPLEYRGKRRA